jgi:transcriptional regulator GlxA family with amidase domain
MTGFADASSFGRAYRRRHGVAPSASRREGVGEIPSLRPTARFGE